jgi:hypothetical protein
MASLNFGQWCFVVAGFFGCLTLFGTCMAIKNSKLWRMPRD